MIEPSSMVSTTARSGSAPAARRASASASGRTTQPRRSSSTRSSLNATRSLPAWVLSSTLTECHARMINRSAMVLIRDSVVGSEAFDDVAAGFFVVAQLDLTVRLHLLKQLAEGLETVVALGEPGAAALEGLLDHGAPDLFRLVAVAEQRLDRFQHQVERFLTTLILGAGVARRCRSLFSRRFVGWRGLCRCRFLLALFRRFLLGRALLALGLLLAVAHQVVVEDELVAVGGQQVRGRALHTHADDQLVVFA